MKRKKSRMDMLAQQILAMQEELEEVTGKHPASRDTKSNLRSADANFAPQRLAPNLLQSDMWLIYLGEAPYLRL